MRWPWWKVILLGGCVNDGWWGLLKVYLARVMKCICQGEEYEGQALRLRQTARSPHSTLCREERWTSRFSCNDSLCPHRQGQPDQLNSQFSWSHSHWQNVSLWVISLALYCHDVWLQSISPTLCISLENFCHVAWVYSKLSFSGTQKQSLLYFYIICRVCKSRVGMI